METAAKCRGAERRPMAAPEWEGLVRRYGGLVFVRVLQAVRALGEDPTHEQVEELVQEVYYRLLTRGAVRLGQLRGRGEGRLVVYLSRVAECVVLDQLRKTGAVKRGRSVLVPLDEEGTSLAERAVDPAATPDVLCLIAERRRLLLERCRALPRLAANQEDRRRNLRILRLALLEGWTSQEIAQREGRGLSISAIDTVVYRARQGLLKRGFEVRRR